MGEIRLTKEEIKELIDEERYIETDSDGAIILHNMKDYPVMTMYLRCGYRVLEQSSVLLDEVKEA